MPNKIYNPDIANSREAPSSGRAHKPGSDTGNPGMPKFNEGPLAGAGMPTPEQLKSKEAGGGPNFQTPASFIDKPR